MSEKPARFQSFDWTLAIFRWLLFAGLYAFTYLASPTTIHSTSFQQLAALAAAYCALMSLLAAFGLVRRSLAAAMIGLDLLFIGALIVDSGGNDSPLQFFLLIPAVIAALRFRRSGGLLAATAVVILWFSLALPSYHTLSLAQYALGLGSKVLLLSLVLALATLRVQAPQPKPPPVAFNLGSEHIRAIYELTGSLTATLNHDRVLESVLDIGMMGLSDLDIERGKPLGMVLLFTKTEQGQQLRIAAYRNLSDEDAKRLLPGKEGLLGHIMTAVEPTMAGDPAQDPELRLLPSLSPYHSVAAVPLRAGFELFGAALFADQRPDAYQAGQIAFLGTLCNQATIALQNAQLYQQLQLERDRILKGEEDLRHWLARELHDGATQTISAVAMRLNYARLLMEKDPSKAIDEMADLEKMARRATKEIRTTLFTLRPLALETQGLRAALEQYVERLRETGGTPVVLDAEEPLERLESTAESTIFSIIEEAVNNARKHANAASITVRLARYGDLLVVTIHDNGTGFDLQAVESSYSQRGSLGLVNMRERAELINGTLELDSRPGRGTTVTLAVPTKGPA